MKGMIIMKKIIAFAAALCITASAAFTAQPFGIINSESVSFTVSAANEKISDNGVIYTMFDGYATVTGREANTVNVVIKPEINGVPVTAVFSTAFNSDKLIKSVEIPDSVTVINDR